MDGFARVLQLAQDVLDDPSLDPEELARRAYLSRFHFDRLIAAAAGEPPGALRRRLLLERAAYRLLDERYREMSVLDVAVEAGYASNEAFTRAFSRAYGRTPSALRESEREDRPTTFRRLELAAPSGVHFQPPGSLRLPAAQEQTAGDLVRLMVTHHIRSLTGLLDACAGLPEEVIDAPVTSNVETIDASADRPTTVRHALNAMVTQEEHWLNALLGAGWPDDSDHSVDGLRARHRVAGAGFHEVVAEAVAERTLADTFIDTTCGPPTTHTLGGTVAHVITFGAVRRTLVVGALETAGVRGLDDLADPRPWIDQQGMSPVER